MKRSDFRKWKVGLGGFRQAQTVVQRVRASGSKQKSIGPIVHESEIKWGILLKAPKFLFLATNF